jgi:hypothetical protein
MAAQGCPGLRELFDDAPTPHIAHPPHTHHRAFYIATDGSDRDTGGGLGVVIETGDGRRVARLARPDAVPDNNVAEYRALHLGLDVLAARAPPATSVGVLLDHDDLASNVNAAVLAAEAPDDHVPHPISVPARGTYHWRGIRARLSGFDEVRAATIDSRENPAHVLANTPDAYAHVDGSPRCVLPDRPTADDETAVPPPSRHDRRAGD